MIPMPSERETWIFFGDGCMAMLVDTNPITNVNPVMREFEFRPSRGMRFKHQIEDNEYIPMTMTIKKQYREDLSHALDNSPNFNKWFIDCDYRGNPTLFFEKIDKRNLIKARVLMEENKTLKIALAREQMNNAKRTMHPIATEDRYIEKMAKIKKVVAPTTFEQAGAQQTEDDEET